MRRTWPIALSAFAVLFAALGFLAGSGTLSPARGADDTANPPVRSMLAKVDSLAAVYDTLATGYSRLGAEYNRLSRSSKEAMAMSEDMGQMGQTAIYFHWLSVTERRAMLDPDDNAGRPLSTPQALVLARWNRMMGSLDDYMVGVHQHAGRIQIADLHFAQAERHRRAAAVYERLAPHLENGDSTWAAWNLKPAQTYTYACASCHAIRGEGVSNATPALVESEWISGDKGVLIRILLNGLSGSLLFHGQRFSGVMPPVGDRLSDEQIAGLLTYLRNSWGSVASDVSAAEVAAVRKQVAGRREAWSPDELKALGN